MSADTRTSTRRLFGTPPFSGVADWHGHWISYSELRKPGVIHRAH